VLPLAALVGVTAISGAFVAGLDAGHAYNTFPTMNGAWLPEEYWDIPGWRNAFENTAAVQLHHRALALTTLAAVGGVWLSARRLALPPAARTLLNATAAVTAAQVGVVGQRGGPATSVAAWQHCCVCSDCSGRCAVTGICCAAKPAREGLAAVS
jgi:heme A synthase